MGELYEYEVMWEEKCYESKKRVENDANQSNDQKLNKLNYTASEPISIPKKQTSSTYMCMAEYYSDDDEDEEEEMEIVPPHILVSRSRSGERMIDSVRMSQGRTLKGRELKHVRDSVLRMTGFLEV